LELSLIGGWVGEGEGLGVEFFWMDLTADSIAGVVEVFEITKNIPIPIRIEIVITDSTSFKFMLIRHCEEGVLHRRMTDEAILVGSILKLGFTSKLRIHSNLDCFGTLSLAMTLFH
jgi:hypothetical protein